MSVEGPLRSGGLNGIFYSVCPGCPLKNVANARVSPRFPCSAETHQDCKEEFDKLQTTDPKDPGPSDTPESTQNH